ncbi:hypothetical protein FB451DRAFT_1548867 [Mycena latifolia]|nr:hypothetical protein FB451DRAFT_1548867 [Mycena latifolia]
MPRKTFASTSSLNIPTRPALASRSVISSKSTPSLPSRQLSVSVFPPSLIHSQYVPDADFQSNRSSGLRTTGTPKLVGLGIGFIDTSPPQLSENLLCRTDTSPETRPRHPRRGSSFDYEKSMASMKIEEDSVSLDPPVASTPQDDEILSPPQFNSLYDLDVQYPSSRSLNAPSPDSALNYSYSPPKLSSSWSLESAFPSAFTSPADTIPSSSSDIRLLPASWSSSSVKAESVSQPSFYLHTPDMAIPLADINMFQASASSNQSSNGSINPTYITAPLDDCPSLPSPCHHELTCDEDVFQSGGFERNDFIRSLMHTDSPARSDMDDEAYAPTPFASSRMMLPSALPDVVSRPRITKRKSSTQDAVLKIKKEHACSFVPGTPILNAHQGIGQGELEAKARRYQERNPGVGDFDKHWLASFSGKLSAQGEMIKDFRCYILGCTQVNKRRDHMIVHLGSHLDQRPFKCQECPSTFLRKNELKRHENGHSTVRPFGCSHCKSTFRRQDLLTRHLKNKHRREPDDDADKENSRPRKKARTL